jgi:endonuclease-3
LRTKAPSKEVRAERLDAIYAKLSETYPDAHCALVHRNAYELLMATILSAQCTDVRVNMVTPALFKKYPDTRAMAKARVSDVERLIQSTGFYRNKAISLVESSKAIVERHGGDVPGSLEALTKLRGVGRKTANVVLGDAFHAPEGVVVDTHVGRLSRRMGLTRENDPVKVERDLVEITPRENWAMLSHLFISHGRARCTARKPDCAHCEIESICPKIGVVKK